MTLIDWVDKVNATGDVPRGSSKREEAGTANLHRIVFGLLNEGFGHMKRVQWVAVIAAVILLGVWFLNGENFQIPSSGPAVTRYEGVPRIIDGDTIKVAGERIRLTGIDTCEMGQPAVVAGNPIDCGAWARDSLSELIGPREVRCESTERDFYDRALAICYLGDRDLNAAIVRNGIGFAYHRSAAYRQEEAEARKARRGIWLFSDLENPYDYRKQN